MQLSFDLLFPWQTGLPEATLLPGERYRLCFSMQKEKVVGPSQVLAEDARIAEQTSTFCIRFSTYMPLFQSSWGSQCPAGNNTCAQIALCRGPDEAYCRHHDPAPYALLTTPGQPDVAVFGIVDPHIGETVGLLNLAWDNTRHKLNFKTQVAFKDPAEAIKQLQAYFERRYREAHDNQDFRGTRVLLAQMGPQQAQALANRSGKFHVVVSAADLENASRDTIRTVWSPAPGDPLRSDLPGTPALIPRADRAAMGVAPPSPSSQPKYLVVPYPHYVRKDGEPRWITDIGSLNLTITQPGNTWESVSSHLRSDSGIGVWPLQQQSWFRNVLLPSALEECLPDTFSPALPSAVPPVVPPAGNSDAQAAYEVAYAAYAEEQLQFREQYLRVMTLCKMRKATAADVAMLQKRDIFTDLPNYVDIVPPERQIQEILDRIIWKGDFLQLIYVQGSALKKILDQSKTFDDEDKSALSLADERNRALITLGVTRDNDHKEYKINGLALDPNKLYSVATSEFIAMGDTGYPDFASSQVTPPLVPRNAGTQLSLISSLVCRGLSANPGTECLGDLKTADYFDESRALPDDPRVGKTSPRQLKIWSVFHRPEAVPGRGAVVTETPQSASDLLASRRPLWDFNVTKLSLGLTRVAHTGNNFDVKQLFGGLTSSEPSTVSSTAWTSDFAAQLNHTWYSHQIFVSPGYAFNIQRKGQPDDLDQVTQNANRGSLETGYAFLIDGREPEHRDALLTARFETPLVQAFTRIPLKTSSHKDEAGNDVKDQLPVHLDRSYTLFLRPGFRWKRRVSTVELGPEWAHEWNALTGVIFSNGQTLPVPCLANAGVSLSSCTSTALGNNPKAITTGSIVSTSRNNQDHAGMYWKFNMTVPFHRRFSYVLTDTGDWFPVRYATENSTTTLLRDLSQHQFKIDIFPSLSVGPEFDALLYRNKAAGKVNGHFLFQNTILMKAQWTFDWFNRRDIKKQIFNAPASAK